MTNHFEDRDLILSKKESQESMKDAYNKLSNYLSSGLILHGSKSLLEVLNPRQANDDDVNRSHVGKMKGVYGEDTDIRIPIIMALFDEKDKTKGSMTSEYECSSDGHMKVSGKNVFFNKGYVYVLPRETFEVFEDKEKDDRELVSQTSVKPVDIVPINAEIINLLEDIEINFQD